MGFVVGSQIHTPLDFPPKDCKFCMCQLIKRELYCKPRNKKYGFLKSPWIALKHSLFLVSVLFSVSKVMPKKSMCMFSGGEFPELGSEISVNFKLCQLYTCCNQHSNIFLMYDNINKLSVVTWTTSSNLVPPLYI